MGQESLSTPGRSFGGDDRWVSTSLFQWFITDGGQRSGPWRPEEGREAWTGAPDFWERQIKDMMDANIDVLYVHLIPAFEEQRVHLFEALSQLREQGYDVPHVLPFLDPLITWSIQPAIDLATPAGKDEFVRQYIRWFEQYFGANSDPHAESYLAHLDGKVVLDTWHCNPGATNNARQLSRREVESRLIAAFGDRYPTFRNGIYMIATTNGVSLSFADEITHQFSNTAYFSTNTFNGKRPATLKPGYWDQNLESRNPGLFLARNGGVDYVTAWNALNEGKAGSPPSVPPIYHAYIESWNEYDEGTGIYAGDPGPPFITPFNQSGNTDTWSVGNKPREYIDTTARGAAAFNDTLALHARILRHQVPIRLTPGETRTAEIIVRNQGDAQWTGGGGFALGQWDWDPVSFGPARYAIDDGGDEIPKYGGIFHGRPKSFEIKLTAPSEPGVYHAHWQMVQERVAWFGEVLTTTIVVAAAGDFDLDGDVDQTDFGHFQHCLTGPFGEQAEPDCLDADFNGDERVDQQDLNLLWSCLSGANLPADPRCVD